VEGGASHDPEPPGSGAPSEVSFMNKIFVLSTSLVAFGLLFAPAAQAEDTMTKKDQMHMSKPTHHMKKDAMMHKDNTMKGDKMKDDTMQK
jgi:pentapeptide MXKDX repeat protein